MGNASPAPSILVNFANNESAFCEDTYAYRYKLFLPGEVVLDKASLEVKTR